MKKHILYIILFCFLACDSDNQSENLSTETGQGGSLAQFTIVNNYLYIVDESSLKVFNILDIEAPVQVNTTHVGFDIETLFHFANDLYIGSQTGMFIYSLDNPEIPQLLSSVSHFRACDPVVAKQKYAFVTLDGSAGCGGNISALEIYDTSDLSAPKLISRRNLIAPKGLGLFNQFLFVCDDEIKVFDVTNPAESKLVTSIKRSAFDVIIRNDLLIAIGESGLFQYSLSNDSETGVAISELSSISI